jgi:hypothetical protein
MNGKLNYYKNNIFNSDIFNSEVCDVGCIRKIGLFTKS